MTQLREISPRKIAAVLVGWLAVTNVLVWLTHVSGWWPCKVLLFVSLSFLPGLALLRIMRIVLRMFSVGVLYSFGLSVLMLMLSGLATNQILYMFGVARPLEIGGILGMWDGITALLIAAAIVTNRQPLRLPKHPAEKFSLWAWLLLGCSLLLPCLAVMGAFRLNNGGNALFAELTLGWSALFITYVFLLRRRLSNDVLAWFIFVIGLTILLMTSLRGWDIVGHDIEREFRVYTLTHLHGRWNIALDRDPYNACLSITILPEMFAKLLNMSGLVVFKVILQVIFAACPVAIYILLRQYVSKLGALTGAMLFICYPTFIDDSAMLTRQGVAYLFFALAILVISNRAQKKRYKLLFSFCALGAVLSHYSTAYMFVALFAVAVICKVLLTWRPHRKKHASFRWRKLRSGTQRTVLSGLFALLLFAMTFGWYARITETSGGIVMTARESLAAIPKLFSADSDNKSSDTSTALLFSGGKTQAGLYESYLTGSKQTHTPAPAAASDLQYTPTLVSDDMPLTRLGKKAEAVGIHSAIITAMRQNFSKMLQLLALLGVLYATYRLLRHKPDTPGADFTSLSLAGFIVLVLMVVMPVLSVNYGLLRAFQQILIFLILPIMLLLVKVGQRLWGWLSTTLATFGIVTLFLLFTGLFAQVLGGSSPTLSMDNSGIYYALYYSSAADIQSFSWIKQHIPTTGDVRAANFKRAIMHDPTYPFTTAAGILPSQTTADSFVYLDQAQVQTQRLYTYFDSSPIIMTFPLKYYEQSKNQIYSTTSTRIYR